MELSLLWTLASILVFQARKGHGVLPEPVLHFEENIIADDDTTITCTLPSNDCQDAKLLIKMNNQPLEGCSQRDGSHPNISCKVEVTRDMYESEVICEAQCTSWSKPEKMMIQTEPTFTDCPEPLVWVEGQETSFHCKAEGWRLPEVTCQRNGRSYKDGENFTAAKDMSGNYTCTARNHDIDRKTVSVIVEYKPSTLSILVDPTLHRVGDAVTLTCESDGLPDPTFSWTVPSDDVSFSPDNRTVTVQSLQTNHLGKYECTALNQHGATTKEYHLDLAEKPKILHTTPQPPLQMLEGENVTLTCEASGFPPPHITWDTPKPNVEHCQDGGTIRIWGVKKDHVGEYRCTARNIHGEDTQVHQLTLAVKAKVTDIKVQPSSSVEEGTNVTMTCVAEGVPPPELSWVLPNPDVQHTSDGGVLNIWGATKAHDGGYQCNAQNKHGEDTGTVTLRVKASAKSDSKGGNNSGERRSPVFTTILAATLISTHAGHLRSTDCAALMDTLPHWTFPTLILLHAVMGKGVGGDELSCTKGPQGNLPKPVIRFEGTISEDQNATIVCTMPYSNCLDVELTISANVTFAECVTKNEVYPKVSCTFQVTKEMHGTKFTCDAKFTTQSLPLELNLQQPGNKGNRNEPSSLPTLITILIALLLFFF